MTKTNDWAPGKTGPSHDAPDSEAVPPMGEKDGQPPAPAQVGAQGSVPGPPQVLSSLMVIDDDEDLLALWAVAFEELGVEAFMHTNAEAAMSDAELWEVDLVVTDLDLPRASGTEFIERVREARPELPILCVTGSRERSLISSAYALGAYDCLLKPCSASQIISRAVNGSATQSSSGRLGTVIEGTPYLVDSVIGMGGAGTVYAGIHMDLGRRVAIKMSNLGVGPEATAQVLAEARILEALRGRRIPAVLDFRELADGRALYVMEFIEGETLHRYLERQGGLSLERSRQLLDQVLEGVATAHRKGIVHLDLKPENLIVGVDEDGVLRVKILDFGLAAVAGADVAGFTPGWASPEQCAGLACDERSDVFNLGLLLEAMLTGVPPNAERDFHPAWLPSDLTEVEARAVGWWIEKCRRKEAARRFADAGLARVALRKSFPYFAANPA